MDKNLNLSNPLVSVVMPAFNAEDYIQDAINSVFAQTFQNWELIIIDDGSSDSTAAIISENLVLDVRLKSFYQENGKQSKARNLGIAHAKGFYIAFLDSDDIWLPDKLSVQLKEIETNSVDLVFSESYVFNDCEISDKTKLLNTVTGFLSGNEAMAKFLEMNRIPLLTVLLKKEKVFSANGFSEKLNLVEDYHLWLKMLLQGCVFYGSDKILAAYRVHVNATTNNDKFVRNKLPELLHDLSQNYPEAENIFSREIVRHFKYIYSNSLFTKADLNDAIETNFNYLKKQAFVPFFKTLNYYFGTRITKSILNLLLNA